MMSEMTPPTVNPKCIHFYLARKGAFLSFLLLSATVGPVWAQPYPLWGALRSGPHAVGFKTTWQLDYTRTYNTVFEDSTRYATAKAPRPILINIWYPVRLEGQARPMAYAEYLNIASSAPRLQKFSRQFAAYNREVMVTELFDKSEDELTEQERGAWRNFLETPTAAFRDAPPAPGTFPLLVYRSGAQASYEDNSVLCEYLASHGYVVVGSGFQYADGASFGTESGEASMPDIAFLIAYAQQMPQVNWHKIALGGHSAGAQATMRFQARPQSPVDALFLLDTTQDYHSLSNPLWNFTEPVLENTHNFTEPMLVVAGPAAIFQLMDRLDQAERYYLTIDEVGHNEYISQGIVKAYLASRYGLARVDREGQEIAPEEQKRRSEALGQRFQAICEYILAFLDAHLKETPEAIASLEHRFLDTRLGPEPHVEHVAVGTTLPEAYSPASSVPPTPRQLRRFFDEHGLEATLALLEQYWSKGTPNAIYDPTYGFVWVYELLGRGEAQAAQALFRHYDTAPGDGVRREFLRYCDIMQLLSLEEMARDCFERFLIVDPQNADVQEKLQNLTGGEGKEGG